MKRAMVFVSVALLAGIVFGQEAKEQPKPPLAVRIVPAANGDAQARSIDLSQDKAHFDVVLTNVSDKPVRLWKEWCSWGYFCLSFEVQDGTGKLTAVRKTPRGWDKNFPSFQTLQPGSNMVFEVNFGSDWENPVLPEKGKSIQVKMRAVYEIPPDDEAKKAEVWTGKVASPEEAYVIRR